MDCFSLKLQLGLYPQSGLVSRLPDRLEMVRKMNPTQKSLSLQLSSILKHLVISSPLFTEYLRSTFRKRWLVRSCVMWSSPLTWLSCSRGTVASGSTVFCQCVSSLSGEVESFIPPGNQTSNHMTILFSRPEPMLAKLKECEMFRRSSALTVFRSKSQTGVGKLSTSSWATMWTWTTSAKKDCTTIQFTVQNYHCTESLTGEWIQYHTKIKSKQCNANILNMDYLKQD